jgi:hypothetical protein
MRFFKWPRQHGDVAGPRQKHETLSRRLYFRNATQEGAQPPDLDAQPRAMRLIGVPGPECAPEQGGSWNVLRPSFSEGADKGEEHRAPFERDHLPAVTHDMAKRVDDEHL